MRFKSHPWGGQCVAALVVLALLPACRPAMLPAQFTYVDNYRDAHTASTLPEQKGMVAEFRPGNMDLYIPAIKDPNLRPGAQGNPSFKLCLKPDLSRSTDARIEWASFPCNALAYNGPPVLATMTVTGAGAENLLVAFPADEPRFKSLQGRTIYLVRQESEGELKTLFVWIGKGMTVDGLLRGN